MPTPWSPASRAPPWRTRSAKPNAQRTGGGLLGRPPFPLLGPRSGRLAPFSCESGLGIPTSRGATGWWRPTCLDGWGRLQPRWAVDAGTFARGLCSVSGRGAKDPASIGDLGADRGIGTVKVRRDVPASRDRVSDRVGAKLGVMRVDAEALPRGRWRRASRPTSDQPRPGVGVQFRKDDPESVPGVGLAKGTGMARVALQHRVGLPRGGNALPIRHAPRRYTSSCPRVVDDPTFWRRFRGSAVHSRTNERRRDRALARSRRLPSLAGPAASHLSDRPATPVRPAEAGLRAKESYTRRIPPYQCSL